MDGHELMPGEAHACRIIRIIRSAAPIRICDNGGWTDTWFARHGCVFNLAVTPCVDVEVCVTAGDEAGAGSLTIHAENFGPPYTRDPQRRTWDRHPLIEAAIDAVPLPADLAPQAAACHVHVRVHSEAPPGASVGSSAATTVAVLGALAHLAGDAPDAVTLAAAAHRVETERLGQQSGIQDQLAAACGGASFIEMDAYPHARVTSLPIDADLQRELDARLTLIYLGRAHESSAIHDRVIAELSDRGPDAPPLEALRRAARAARDAFVARDLAALGRAFQDNTEAQGTLHPDLIGPAARRVIAIARGHEALGWKVNGAGGDGGSIAILGGPSHAATQAMRRAIETDDPTFRIVPIRISPAGVRVWELTSRE